VLFVAASSFFLTSMRKDSHRISSVAPSLQFRIETLFYLTSALAHFVVYSHVRTLSHCHKAPQGAVQSVKYNSFCADESRGWQCDSQDAAAAAAAAVSCL
jgi:hypothetical protein